MSLIIKYTGSFYGIKFFFKYRHKQIYANKLQLVEI